MRRRHRLAAAWLGHVGPARWRRTVTLLAHGRLAPAAAGVLRPQGLRKMTWSLKADKLARDEDRYRILSVTRVDRDPEQLGLQHDHGEPGGLAGSGVVEPDRDGDHRLSRRQPEVAGDGRLRGTFPRSRRRRAGRSASSPAWGIPGPHPGQARCPVRRADRSGRRWIRQPVPLRTPRRTGSRGSACRTAGAGPRARPGGLAP